MFWSAIIVYQPTRRNIPALSQRKVSQAIKWHRVARKHLSLIHAAPFINYVQLHSDERMAVVWTRFKWPQQQLAPPFVSYNKRGHKGQWTLWQCPHLLPQVAVNKPLYGTLKCYLQSK
jgi:hypothetical protein